jgi:dethiobiotin synthetase
VSKRIFVTGIGTGVGKTVVSALLCKAWNADYWKPVQTGFPGDRDADTVRQLTSGSVHIYPEAQLLKLPLSPHAAAAAEQIFIRPDQLHVPETENLLVIEGAGGLHVPLNDFGDLMIDLIPQFGASAVLVSRHYLGSINHTLLSLEALAARRIPVAGIVYVGNELPDTEIVINALYPLRVLARIPELDVVDAGAIAEMCSTVLPWE